MLLDETKFKTPPMVDAVGNTLLEAAAVIEKYGWIQYSFGHIGIGFCACGAIRKVTPKDDERTKAINKLSAYLSGPSTPTYFAPITEILAWNDVGWRTKEEVLASFRGAART